MSSRFFTYGCGCSIGAMLGYARRCSPLSGQIRRISRKRHTTKTSKFKGAGKEERWKPVSSINVKTGGERLQPDEKEFFQPVYIAPDKSSSDIDVGAELTGKRIKTDELLELLRDFYNQPKTTILAAEHGLDVTIMRKSFESFRQYCVKTDVLPVDFYIVLSDVLAGAGHIDDIFPYFLQHARRVFPHLECIEELRNISDLTEPVRWYPEARRIERKIVYHAGPTNSGKTYHALQRFMMAKSGIYCGPLRMLAVEVFNKCNEADTPCDLVTGEDRRQANPDGPAEHVACTVEMASITTRCEVAVIDEIQMLRDHVRGWAWTRALLGINADEIHLCGEAAALDVVKSMVMLAGDDIEVRRYERLTKLTILDKAVVSLDNIKPGDCIVCFSKNDIYAVTQKLEALGHDVAVIYGGLPPGAKYAQAERFNDPDDSCKILVATDAIGMGLNLAIKRVIFYAIMKPTTNKEGERKMERISTSQALQIGGRAGRFGTQYENGEVTTFRRDDLPLLKKILAEPIEPIEQAGLHPTFEQIELFAYHLPKATMSNLIDIFVHLCKLDHDNYFMCNMEDFKFLANMIEHIPLPLRVRYVFCCAPISSTQTFVCNMFLKFARQYDTGRPITYEWLLEKMKAPFRPPKSIQELIHLEQAFDVFDLYQWLGYRFPDMFPDMEFIREAQSELDYVIRSSVAAITSLLKGKTPGIRPAKVISSEKKFGKWVPPLAQPNPTLVETLETSPLHISDFFVNTDKAQVEAEDQISDKESSGSESSDKIVNSDKLEVEAEVQNSDEESSRSEISETIQSAHAVRNIVQSMRNPRTDGLKKLHEIDQNREQRNLKSESLKKYFTSVSAGSESKVNAMMKGELARDLIKKGLISEELIQQLYGEWKDSSLHDKTENEENSEQEERTNNVNSDEEKKSIKNGNW